MGILLVLSSPSFSNAAPLQVLAVSEKIAAHHTSNNVRLITYTDPLSANKDENSRYRSDQIEDQEPNRIPLTIKAYRPPGLSRPTPLLKWINRMGQEQVKGMGIADEIIEVCDLVYQLYTEDGFSDDSRAQITRQISNIDSKLDRYKKVLSNAQRLHYKSEFDDVGQPIRSLVDSIPQFLEHDALSVKRTYDELNEALLPTSDNWCFDSAVPDTFFFELQISINEIRIGLSSDPDPRIKLGHSFNYTGRALLEWMEWQEGYLFYDQISGASATGEAMLERLESASDHLKGFRKSNKAYWKNAIIPEGFEDMLREVNRELEKSYKKSADVERKLIKELRKIAIALTKIRDDDLVDSKAVQKYDTVNMDSFAKFEELNAERTRLDNERRNSIQSRLD